ncbi:MAG: alpha/beta hydrolase [Gammaproteobacteria bacterium]|nr:alpha/beta hydrolase [Gammaproteobacteria bacterium]MDE0368153.1 alpha/beta hydrolase [Gammaproteobacteria bacterium]
MPYFVNDDVRIYYEESGTGFPVLLIAPGGMKSAIPVWANAPWHPVEQLSSEFRVIAMDQRNAGRSSAPVSAGDSWHVYTEDQLGLMDHLGIGRFHVAGMCIGGAYAMSLIQAAPERVASAVMFQPIGLSDNRNAFFDMFNGWADELRQARDDVAEGDLAAFRETMYGGDFVFSASREFVEGVTTPLLVLLGNDLYHPSSTSREVVALARNAELIERWKEPEDQPAARARVLSFLRQHSD